MVGQDRTPQYKENSLSLVGAVALGTGVMIGAGIFALTGQMAEMTGRLFPLAFLAAAVIVSFSAYSYVKMSNTFPSAGGIGMYLQKAYGPTLPTAFHALLMYFSMVIAQSFLYCRRVYCRLHRNGCWQRCTYAYDNGLFRCYGARHTGI